MLFFTNVIEIHAIGSLGIYSSFSSWNNGLRSGRPGITDPPEEDDDDEPDAPNGSPIGDSLWVILALSACYGAIKYKQTKAIRQVNNNV
ncbi:MAG: hypothetical protein LBH32_10650 [Dysgonamonadaceae bacterium]|nr:hypothetical protein [Dysgonamonadaceae bacterium]